MSHRTLAALSRPCRRPSTRLGSAVVVGLLITSGITGNRLIASDTIDGRFEGVGAVQGGQTLELQVTGRAGVPDGAAAVVMNVTAVAPQAPGYVTVFPCGQSRPLASNLNYQVGDVVPNLVIAKPNSAGKVCLYSRATSDLVADVSGFFPAGSEFTPIPAPKRILDTRPATEPTTPGDPGAPGGQSPGIPAFDSGDFLQRNPGSTELRLQDCGTSWGAGNDKYPGCTPRDSADGPFNGIGTFRVFCEYSHQNYDDPIVFPGGFGNSHLHLFFGNTTTDADSNVAAMQNVGGSTCDGGIADRSAYWVPTLFDPAAEEIIEPWIFAAYYQSGFSGLDPTTIQPIPAGLRMITGNAGANPDTYDGGGFTNGGRWGCFNGGGGPTNAGGDIPDCGSDRVTLVLNFPQCWDGVNLDSADHKSHMASPQFGFGGGGSTCPSSHPVPLPSIMLQVVYQTNGSDSDAWRLTSDNYPSSRPGGASLHGDFVNGWNPTIMNRWLDNCVKATKDCERSELGGGQALASRFFR